MTGLAQHRADEPETAARLPDFLVIGAMRAGTSSTWEYLRSHPQVYMAEPKELHFFDRPQNFARGPQWYAQHFAAAGDAAVTGEATPAYARHPEVPGVPERAAALLPQAKLVYVVRDPLERMRSHYQHAVNHGQERRAFARAITSDPTYVDVSRYAMQLDQWLRHYPRDRVLVVQSERLRTDRLAAMRTVLEFVGADPEHPGFVLPAVERNRTAGQRSRRPGVRRLQASPAARLVLDRLPSRAKGTTKRRLSRLVDAPADRSRAEYSEELRAAFRAELRDDVHRLRGHLPPDFDGWGMS